MNITNPATGYSNLVNAFMDHQPGDGLGQRLNRFNALVEQGQTYTVQATRSSLPVKMRFYLSGRYLNDFSSGVIVKIPYDNLGAYVVIAND